MKKAILILAVLVLILSAFAPPPVFYYYMPIAFGPLPGPPGSVRGAFLRQVGDPITIQDLANLYTPIIGANLYLAEVRWCKGEHPQCGVAILDLVNSPRTITNSNGGFGFSLVSPGDYALVYYEFPIAYLISQPMSAEALWFSVKSNKLTDLGVMKYSCFPTYCLPMSSESKAIYLSLKIIK
jgi:hypothetical protein